MRAAIAAAALLAAAAALGIAVSSVDARSERAATGEIQVTARNVVHTYRAIGGRGRISDASEQAWSLRNRYGHTIGRLVILCRWITQADRFCSGVIRMPRGMIAVSGTSSTSFLGEWAVVGGTELYDGADGSARFVAIGSGRMVLVVTLT